MDRGLWQTGNSQLSAVMGEDEGHRKHKTTVKTKDFVEEPEGKRPLERPKCRWEDGIRMDIRETGWGHVESIQLAQDRDRWWALVNMMMNLWVLAPRS
jgi:hypothetical protein